MNKCSNYYRKLVEIGKIKDSNYHLDEKGNVHHVGTKTRPIVKINKLSEEEEFDEGEGEADDYEKEKDSGEGKEKYNGHRYITNVRNDPVIPGSNHLQSNEIPRSLCLFHENPLPGFIDTITRTEVIRPAISPYGHVLSYDTWLKCLLNGDRKNTCPLTNQPLHKRQLIFLTEANIAMYRDKISKINE